MGRLRREAGVDDAVTFLGLLAGAGAPALEVAEVLAVEELAAKLRTGGLSVAESVRQALRAVLREREAKAMIGRQSGVERALIGTDQRGVPVVLATDGAWIACDCGAITCNADDIGLVSAKDCPEPGLYLWEGRGKVVITGAPWDAQEEDTVYEGTLRGVQPDEVEALYAMTPPGCERCGGTGRIRTGERGEEETDCSWCREGS